MRGYEDMLAARAFEEARKMERESRRERVQIILGAVLLAGVMGAYVCFSVWDARINAEIENIMHEVENTYYTMPDGRRVYYREVKDPSVWLVRSDGKYLNRPNLLGK